MQLLLRIAAFRLRCDYGYRTSGLVSQVSAGRGSDLPPPGQGEHVVYASDQSTQESDSDEGPNRFDEVRQKGVYLLGRRLRDEHPPCDETCIVEQPKGDERSRLYHDQLRARKFPAVYISSERLSDQEVGGPAKEDYAYTNDEEEIVADREPGSSSPSSYDLRHLKFRYPWNDAPA